MRPQQLFTQRTATHAHRGQDFEKELCAVHEYYLMRGTVDIVKNPTEWVYAGERDFAATASKNPDGVARTAGGRVIRRVRSNVDFSGGNGKQAFCFDAKETAAKTFPLSSVHEHQVHRLLMSAKCGVTAGLMIWFTASDVDRVFFLSARILDKKFEDYRKQAPSKHRPAAKGTASFSIAELEQVGEEIARQKVTGLLDWYAVLEKE